MKSIGKLLGISLILGGFVAVFTLLHAQENATLNQSGTVLTTAPTDVSAMSDLQVEVKAIEMTTPLPASAAPQAGNFYSTQHLPGTENEWPPLPANIRNTALWPLGDDFYLLDDANVNYDAPTTKTLTASGGMQAMSMSVPSPDDGGDTNAVVGEALSSFTPLNLVAGTNLWLEITNLANNTAGLLLSNTIADVQYEILAAPTLTGLIQTGWVSVGSVFGDELTNWTPTSVAATNQPALFLRVRSDIDSAGVGIPDWWQLQYFGYVGIDPYGDPAGDGWSNLQKYEYGMNPNSFNSPPAPQGVTVTYNPGSNMATVSWLPSSGPVTGYTVSINGSVNYNVSSPANSFQIAVTPSNFYSELGNGDPNLIGNFQVQANYTGGNSAWSASVPLEANAYSLLAYFIPGQQGSANLVVSALPPGTVKLRVTRIDVGADESYGDSSFDTNFDIPVSLFTNGLYVLPSSLAGMGPVDSYGYSVYSWWAQTVDANGNVSGASILSPGYYDDPSFNYYPQSGTWPVTPYFDGREQIKQNLIFMLRASLNNAPIQAFEVNSSGTPSGTEYIFPVNNYAYDSFYDLNAIPSYAPTPYDSSSETGVFFPFGENYFYRNFVFTLTNADSDGLLASFDNPFTLDSGNSSYDYFGMLQPPAYQFQPPTVSGTAIAPLLATNQTRWLLLCQPNFDSGNSPIGMIQSGGTNQLASNFYNAFGLQFLSTEMAWGNTGSQTYTDYPGVKTTDGGWFYSETAQPQFQTAEYDFWNAPYWPYLNTNLTVLPGMPGFSTTNKSQLLIANVGERNFQVAGYAKLAVQNGYSGVYGYLGQYFDQAYQINTNGVVTTNTTGVLSPYGQFFPTQPGPAALVTMPDLDTGARGTATVYTVSAVIDRSQGSNMDLSFTGVNATSANDPAVIWCNNNHDRWFDSYYGTGFELEQDDLSPAQISTLHWEQQVPDCQYTTNLMPAIPCTRDLEDYFRLWTPGVAALMKILPPNYTVQLTLTGTGQIRIFQAVESSGGTNYLFDETTASNQVANSTSLYAGLLSSSSPIIFNNQTNFNEHFIFCGAQTGSAQIDLQILDGSLNVIADAPVYLQINDIKNMYERWTVGDDSAVAPLAAPVLAGNDMPIPPQAAFQYALPSDTNTPYILHVHGYNMAVQDKDHFAETEFKRLYWQGYKGRFGEFRWPTTQQGIFNLFSAFNLSESNAWASAKGLTNLLTRLNAEYPGNVYLTAHSHGNVAAGEALKLAGANQMVNTYIAMQAALAAHAYDPTTPYQYTLPYPDYYAQYYPNGGTDYFNNVKGAGKFVNFFNTNDWALTGPWPQDQLNKPVSGYSWLVSGGQTNFYSGSNPYYTLLLLPADRYTVFSYCDPATCYALGAQVNVGGVFSTNNQVPLSSVSPPDPGNYTAHLWHSAEFRSDNPQRYQFWNQVLVKMKLKSQ